MFLHSWHPQPLIATMAGLQLRWYGLLLAIAALLGIWIVVSLAKQYRLNVDRVFDLALLTIIAGFLGARLYHVLNEWPYYQAHLNEIVKVWNGGLAIHGGLLGGGLAVVLIARRWRWDGWLLADILAPALAFGQAIGRWGNYFNQELFGRPTGRPWGIPIDPLNRPPAYLDQGFFHPTFLYESLGLLLIGGLVWWLHRHRRSAKGWLAHSGNIALIYLGSAALLRMTVESLRIDRTPIIGGVRLPILVGLLIATVAVILLVIRNPRAHAHPTA